MLLSCVFDGDLWRSSLTLEGASFWNNYDSTRAIVFKKDSVVSSAWNESAANLFSKCFGSIH